jgi:sugar transferase EpsL
MIYKKFGKRLLDLVVTILALIPLAPVMLLLAILVRLKLGSPVIFRQQRPGLHGKPFTIYKFRTMTQALDARGNQLLDSERLTPLGRFLRKTSLDELPELLNVLKNGMSLVGPRPLLIDYLEHYTPEQNRRHEVLPGITGCSQINGRQSLPFSKRLELDCWYVDHQSFWLDLQILLMTIPKVFLSRGVILGQDVKDVDDLNLSYGHASTLKLAREDRS